MLPAAVLSSGRKLRLFPGWQMLRQMLRLAAGGLRAVRRREGLEFWYDGRREAVDLRLSIAQERPRAAKADPP